MHTRRIATPRARGAATPTAIFALSFLTGAISLGYQVIWFRINADRFGSSNLTFLLVLVAFIAGLGLGAVASRRIPGRLKRIAALTNPVALVGAIELAISISVLFTLFLNPSHLALGGAFPYSRDARGYFEPVVGLGLEATLAAAGMLLPTFLMGATFPILCDAFRGNSVFPSEWYAWNTLGAGAGVLLSEFVLLPGVGQTRALVMLAGFNLIVAFVFLRLARGSVGRAAAAPQDASAPAGIEIALGGADVAGRVPRHGSLRGRNAAPPFSLEPALVLALGSVSGFVCGALEVDMLRAVRFAGAITDAAMSFTSFWAVAAIFAASATVRTLGKPRGWLVRLALPAALVAYSLTWLNLHAIRGRFNDLFLGWAATHARLHPGLPTATNIYPLSGSLLLILAFTGVIVLPTYFLASLVLPTLCNVVQSERRHLGVMYGLNTVAFCAGAVLFSWVVPGVSLFYAVKLLFVVLAGVALFALFIQAGRVAIRVAAAVAVLSVVAGAVLIPGGFDRRFFPEYEAPARYPVRALKSNAVNTTYVVEDPHGFTLFFDSYPMSGTGPMAQRYMRLMAHMPLLVQREPRRALLICFGAGNTAAAIASHHELSALDIVDLDDKVFETAPEFAHTNGGVYQDPRVRLIHDDGRRYLDRVSETYDLVTSEPPPPRAAGVYRLYSEEYYRSVLAHLTADGRMTQWLPVNLLSKRAADRLVATFASVFPHVLLFVGTDQQLILMGGRAPFDPALIEDRFASAAGAREDLARIGIHEPVELLARITRMEDDLRRDVAGARIVSDERNDLALIVADPFDPYRLALDPPAVLRLLEPGRLECGARLEAALSSPRALTDVVPDFPVELAGRRSGPR